MPRLFTAFEIPPEIAAQLAFFRGGLLGARWIEPQDYHVTLRFFGDIDARTARGDVATISPRRSMFPAARRCGSNFDEIGVFGGRQPRALYARVKPDPLLTRLQARPRGHRPAQRPGARKPANSRPMSLWRGCAASSRKPSAPGWRNGPFRWRFAFEAERFALYSSRNSVGGGPYRIEAVYPFLIAPDQSPSSAPTKGNCR